MNRLGVIDKELCKPHKCGHECVKACPVNRKGEDCIVIKEFSTINELLCIGCGLCVKQCPFHAITVVNLPEKLNEMPVHRFGKNEFVLFRLPIPVKGVVGLIGPNGVGKSTALKILAGKIEPNLGCYDSSEFKINELIRVQRGTELQAYLENLIKNNITVSYKPQIITEIRGVENKTISDLHIRKDLIEKFGLVNIIHRKFRLLSGGELQRMAIAAAITKQADVYYFDEPTSYLDVKQRLVVAKAIRELAETKYVIVVDHDLATLDFLADSVHIFYGEPGVFGVVSKPYVVKRGINTFLDGYIPEDNVRIRDPTIFEKRKASEKKTAEVLVEFINIKKSFNEFSLNIDKGVIYKGEVLGIFGENGLGKSTFAKIAAGELESEGDISKKLRISYKPQYIRGGDVGTVKDIIGVLDSDLLRKLDIEHLMEKQMKNLSGGELQRIAIAICLSKNADLYLLDEPSAYLDVDQRLNVAKILRSMANSDQTIAVIDHDLLFLSYVADRAMLFMGDPGKKGFVEFLSLEDGFNKFLKSLNITFRQEPNTGRPRANKPNSVIDREQKKNGKYFI